VKALFVTLILCSVASAKVKPSPKLPGRRVPGDARGFCPHELLWDSVWFEWMTDYRPGNQVRSHEELVKLESNSAG
jgi:hypothetical protein